jgi:hypothetical protein
MFRIPLKFFSSNWLKFFSKTNEPKVLSLYRSMKEISDYSKAIGIIQVFFIQESYFEGYSNITDKEIMKIASIFKELKMNLYDSHKQIKFLNSLLEIIVHRIETEKSVEWNSVNIKHFFLFLIDHKHFIGYFNIKNIQNVLDIAYENSDTFLNEDFAIVANFCYEFLPDQHYKFWEKLMKNLSEHAKLEICSLKGLSIISKGIFYNEIPQTTFKPILSSDFFSKFKQEILKKISNSDILDVEFHSISLSLSKFKSIETDEILETLLDKIYTSIEYKPELIQEPVNFIKVYDIFKAIEYLEPNGLAQELFRSLTARLFLNNFSEFKSEFNEVHDYVRMNFIRSYLYVAERLDLFQVVYLDVLVDILSNEIHGKYFRTYPAVLADCLKSLAYLNYPGRFGAKIPSKPEQWTNWEMLIERTEDLVLGLAYSLIKIKDPNNINYEYTDESVTNIHFLWSFCIFNRYSKDLIRSLVSNIDITAQNNLTEGICSKLFHIQYWLQLENNDKITLSDKVLEKMKEFKDKWDNSAHPVKEHSKLKNIVKEKLVSEGSTFKENFHEFPYYFDFVYSDKKLGIIVDDDQEFLHETSFHTKNGLYKIMNRQLAYLGWSVKRISIKNWLNTIN